MRRATRDWLTTILPVTSLLFMVGPIAAAVWGWLDRRDFLVQITVLPGGFIIGGILYLVNGCVEYYADVLPPKYRERPSQETVWRLAFPDADMTVVQTALKEFASSNGFRREDAFQFHPEDRIWQLFGDFFPERKYPELLDEKYRDAHADDPAANDPASAAVDALLRSNATLAEYVRAGLDCIRGS